jgi:hypothetical protein
MSAKSPLSENRIQSNSRALPMTIVSGERIGSCSHRGITWCPARRSASIISSGTQLIRQKGQAHGMATASKSASARIVERGCDIFGGQIRKLAKDFLCAAPGSQIAKDQRHGNPRSPNAGLAAQDRRIALNVFMPLTVHTWPVLALLYVEATGGASEMLSNTPSTGWLRRKQAPVGCCLSKSSASAIVPP